MQPDGGLLVAHSVVFLGFDGEPACDVAFRFNGDFADGDVATLFSRTVLACEPACERPDELWQ